MLDTLSRSLRDNVARLGLSDTAFWIFGKVSQASPATIASNARYRRQGAPDGLPIPPADLIFLVAGSADISWFLTAGSRAAESISDAIRAQGRPIEGLGSILDFGCGCGRVLRNWHSLTGVRVCGTDY